MDNNVPTNIQNSMDNEDPAWDAYAEGKFGKQEKTITISQSYYDQLLKSHETLNALKACGVDNWDGYDMAMDILNGDDSIFL